MPETMENPVCTHCGRVMELKTFGRGDDNAVFECPRECEYAHLSHCWKCHAPIDGRECKEDPGYGYICNNCGESLRGYYAMRKLKNS